MDSKMKYIHELPYRQRTDLCRILDADRRWHELGGNHMNYDFTTLRLIGNLIYCDKSPTSELLNKYSERNGTIERLFIWLYKMGHQRAMSILEPYVDRKHRVILRSQSAYSISSIRCPSQDGIAGYSASQLSVRCSARLTQVSQVPPILEHESGACGTSYKGHFSSKHPKTVRYAPEIKGKAKRSSDPNQLKKNTNSKQESNSNKCGADERIPKRLPVQEILPNGKQLKHSHLASGANYNSQDNFLLDYMKIPFGELCEATHWFSPARILGIGGFGTVYRGEWKGISVAIKRLTPLSSGSPSPQLVSLKQSLNELRILKRCRFDYILPLYAVSLDGVDPCLIYQFMVNGSLADRLLCKKKTPPLTWLQRSRIAECTAKGLNYLHTSFEKPLVHGDIKSANILLDSNMEAKIGDFGLTQEGPNCDKTHLTVTSVRGTQCYLPDEYLRGRKLSPQVDIYSFGIVMLEVATGLRPYNSQTSKKLAENVKECENADRLDSLRDTKAGEENILWFRELIKIGQDCSSTEKRQRPLLQEVLTQFEKVKIEMSKVDKIRRIRNDKGNPFDDVPVNKSPVEPPANAAIGAIPETSDEDKNSSVVSEAIDSTYERLRRRSSFISSSESSNSSECESSVSKELMHRGVSCPDRNVKADTRVPPFPLNTMLRNEVPEFERNSKEPNPEM